MPNSPDHLHYAILKALEENPNLSQRELAQTLGLSLGKANYCLQELIKKGQVKVENFRRQDNKLAYAYILTPAGLAAKVKVTRRFLARKLVEYETLKADIARLQREVGTEASTPPESEDPPSADPDPARLTPQAARP